MARPPSGKPAIPEISFRGRNQTDAKRKALNFWYSNQGRLGLSLREFSAKLILLPDGRTILFKDEKK